MFVYSYQKLYVYRTDYTEQLGDEADKLKGELGEVEKRVNQG